MKNVYIILERPTPYDEWDVMNTQKLLDMIGTADAYTNKRKAIKDCNRLRQMTEAANELRKSEGSTERNRAGYRVVDQNAVDAETGVTVDSYKKKMDNYSLADFKKDFPEYFK